MSNFGYRTELKKYEELDEDELLASLSSEELRELESELADIDPDDNVPIGLRQKDQTAKIPTGTFDRDALLKYWEDENKKLLEDEKEKASPEQQEQHHYKSRELESPGNSSKTQDNDEKIVSQKVKKARERMDWKSAAKEPHQEKKDESKKSKALVGTKMNNSPNKGLKTETRRTETMSSNVEVTPERPSGNPIVIDKALEQILSDDPSMFEVNLNNIEDILPETLLRFADALCTNTHVHVFSLANTHADDRVAFAISKMLRENCSIKNLNIESNFVSGQGILALFAALQHNRTLVELRFHNQRHICGGKVEMEMVQLLRENTTILKLGYQFDLPGPRMAVTSILTRNQDQQRQKRLQQMKEHCTSEVSRQVCSSFAENKPPKNSSEIQHNAENQKKNVPPPSADPPTRKIAEMVKEHEGLNSSKTQTNQRKPKSKKLKNGANEKESVEILKELKNALKPSLQKRRDEPSRLPVAQKSSRDDLMAAIRGSSISSLKRVLPSQT